MAEIKLKRTHILSESLNWDTDGFFQALIISGTTQRDSVVNSEVNASYKRKEKVEICDGRWRRWENLANDY